MFSFFEEIIQRFKDAGKLGTAKSYRDTYLSLKKFQKDKDLYFSEMDYTLLSKYETHLK